MIDNLIQKLESATSLLPSVPIVIAELLQVIENEDVSLGEVSRVIAKDPAMSMNVLKIANSAFYRLPQKVTSVEHAVRLLGLKEITMLCLASGALKTLKAPIHIKTFDMEEFWKHSIATGVFARRICSKLRLGDPGTAYLSGLLHDIGKAIIDRYAHDIYTIVIQTTYDENISMREAEKKVIGESHDTVGGWIMEKWRFPQVFVDVARFHHEAEKAPPETKTDVAVVALADQFARVRMYGFGGDLTGIIFSETEGFRIIEEANPDIWDMDIVKFIWDLEGADEEIGEVESILKS